MRKIAVFIVINTLISICMAGCLDRKADNELTKELDMLDECLGKASEYDAAKQVRLDSLQRLLKMTSADEPLRQWELNMELGNQYHAFCSDSATYYFNRALELAVQNDMQDRAIDSRINLSNAQGAAGLFTLAYLSLSSLDLTTLNKEQHFEYAKAARQLYSYMQEYGRGHENEVQPLVSRGKKYEQFLIDSLPEDSQYRRFLYAQQLHQHGNNIQARSITKELLESLPENSNLYGMTAFLMANIARADGEDTEYGKYLTLASISDIKACVKETMALPALAKWLYNKGKVDRAYRYINASIQDAMRSNARMRTVEIAGLLPMVDDAYRKKISSSRDELILYFTLVVVLFIIAGVSLAAVFRTMRRTASINRKLAEQSKIQESYIGHFIGMCSSYSEKLESLRRLVNRKVSAGQTDELLKMLKSGKYSNSENDDFFHEFDETFLDLYPDFIEKLNDLLRPECRLTYKKGTPLTTELRIYAFVRLGVEESVRIAQILHCSVSTIYTYRNRMRGRAINRESFEKDVMAIGTPLLEA